MKEQENDHGAALLRVDPSAKVQTEPLPVCGDCRYQQRDEHGGGRDDCALRSENVPHERYRYGWDKACSTFDDRGFREFKPNAETMDKIVDGLRSELRVTDELLAERQRVLDAIPECPAHGSCVPNAIEWITKAKYALAQIGSGTQDSSAERAPSTGRSAAQE